MKIEVTEFIRETFEVEVDDGLTGEDLNAAVEHARVHFDGIRNIEVTSVEWDT